MVLQSLVNGTLMGAMYGVSALGLGLIYGVLHVVNFAHGALIMVGMYIAYWLHLLLPVNIYVLIIPVFVIMLFLGIFLERVVIRPGLRARSAQQARMNAVLVTVCVMMVMENLTLIIFGANYYVADTSIKSMVFTVGDVTIIASRLFGAIIAFGIAIALHIVLKNTDIGRSIRATSQQKDAALTLGINAEKTFGIAFGIGCAIAGVAGLLFLSAMYVAPTVGNVFTTKAFIIVVLGGMGSMYGAMLGGLVVGLIESMVAIIMPTSTVEMLVFIVFIGFLFLRPNGLLGKKVT